MVTDAANRVFQLRTAQRSFKQAVDLLPDDANGAQLQPIGILAQRFKKMASALHYGDLLQPSLGDGTPNRSNKRPRWKAGGKSLLRPMPALKVIDMLMCLSHCVCMPSGVLLVCDKPHISSTADPAGFDPHSHGKFMLWKAAMTKFRVMMKKLEKKHGVGFWNRPVRENGKLKDMGEAAIFVRQKNATADEGDLGSEPEEDVDNTLGETSALASMFGRRRKSSKNTCAPHKSALACLADKTGDTQNCVWYLAQLPAYT